MMYFLDFDRTLFDTDSFREYLAGRYPAAGVDHMPNSLGEAVEQGKIAFEPGELSRFVYSDVAEFLRAAGNEAIIITFGNATAQRAKIESALHGIPRISAHFTGDLRKGEYLHARPGLFREALLVDDAPLELEAAAALFPNLALYEMRRDGEAGDGRWPVIRSLNELP